jgi:hypothetical protein
MKCPAAGGYSQRRTTFADAVQWAAAQGHTDPARDWIAGTGYGGVSALPD